MSYKRPGPALDCQDQISEKGHMIARDILYREATFLSQKPRLGEKFAWAVLDREKPAANDYRVREKPELRVRFASGKLFPGQYYDAETGRHYNYFRDYDPATGRYIESDPIGVNYDFSDPQLQLVLKEGFINSNHVSDEDVNHLYNYVDNEPLNLVDMFGLAGNGNGGVGSSSGVGTNSPYKHCKDHPTDPTKIICKNKKDGKKVTKPKPADWDSYKNDSAMCGEGCTTTLMTGTLIVGACACVLFPEVCLPALGVGATATALSQ